MKRILLVVLCISMLFSFASCSLDSLDRDEIEETKETEKKINKPSSEFKKGEVSDNVYYSEFSDMALVIPDGWGIKSDEELAEIMSIGFDVLDYNEYMRELAEQGTIYDLYMMDSDNNNVIVSYENLKALDAMDVSAKEYAELTIDQINSSGIDYEFSDIEAVRLAGNEYAVFNAYTDYYVNEVYQRYYCRKTGDYMLNVVVSAVSEDILAEFDDMFTK